MRLVSLWYSGPMRNLDRVCVASWVRLGFEVEIFSFGPVEGLPKGAILSDANQILDGAWVEKINPVIYAHRKNGQRMMNYSDLFRVALMKQGRGLWLDTDLLLFRRFDVDPQKPFFAWEDWHRIGSPVFYLPPDSPMIPDYERVYDSPDLMPHWLGFRRRVLKPLIWRLQGKAFGVADLGVTIYGNDAFTRLARKHHLMKYALPRQRFYAWNAHETERFYDPAHGGDLWDNPDVWGIHVHQKPAPNRRPQPGSMFDRAARLSADLLPDLRWQD